ncbi:mitochondrial import receptor subunit Tom6p [Diutina catenulata]
MAGRFVAPGGAPAPAKEATQLEKIIATPAFAVAWQVTLFAAGVGFIQSSLMDMLVPQL